MLVDAAFASKLSGSPQAAIGFGTQAQSMLDQVTSTAGVSQDMKHDAAKVSALVDTLLATPAPVYTTVLQLLNSNCATAKDATALELDMKEEADLNNSGGAAVYAKQAARIEYECIDKSPDSHAKDWFTYFYAADLLQSAVTNNDAMSIGDLVARKMNDLVYSTKFDDVRKAAAALKQSASSTSATAHDAVYGTPTPTDTPRPFP
jgi:hypothetical protein